jgi:hypothetical protein
MNNFEYDMELDGLDFTLSVSADYEPEQKGSQSVEHIDEYIDIIDVKVIRIGKYGVKKDSTDMNSIEKTIHVLFREKLEDFALDLIHERI